MKYVLFLKKLFLGSLFIILPYTVQAESNVYDVIPVSSAPELSSSFSDNKWNESPVLSGSFHFPWEFKVAPKTSFRSVHDDNYIYFAFDVVDKDVLVLNGSIGERETVDKEDRVEIFFASGSIDKPINYKMPIYYAIEIDPIGRVHDYAVTYYRNIDSNWNMPGLNIVANKTPYGYKVTGLIPLESLNKLGLISLEGELRVGLYRAEFSGNIDNPTMQWISWVNPQTPIPDYHVNTSFGTFRLLK